MALRTDMWLDAVDDYAKAYDKGVDAELENMKTGASLESWTGKMQELKEACICMPRHFLMCWLAARSLGKDLFSDETYTREFEEFICKVKPLKSLFVIRRRQKEPGKRRGIHPKKRRRTQDCACTTHDLFRDKLLPDQSIGE